MAKGNPSQKRKWDGGNATSSLPSKRQKAVRGLKSPSDNGTQKLQANQSPAQIISSLLSRKAESTIAEQEDSSKSKQETGWPSSAAPQLLTPFEELLSTVVLSRPIQHNLGHRAVNTLLNEPYNLHTPSAVLDAGEERIYEALDKAKTLHKDKTAAQLIGLAQTVLDKFAGEGENKEDGSKGIELKKLRHEANGDAESLKKVITEEVKGLGDTGAGIFVRRIQRFWTEFWPFIDARTSTALETLGLPGEAKDLKTLLEDCWDDLKLDSGSGKDEETQKRRIFVQVLEGAIDADLKNQSGRGTRQTRSASKKAP